MSIAKDICHLMRQVSRCHELDDGGVLINTHCMYPSNGAVQVIIRGTASGFVVTDDGGAMREAVSAGAQFTRGADSRFAKVAEAQGLMFQGGIVSAPTVPLESVSLAILLVANVSKEIADAIFASWKAKKDRDFKSLVRDMVTHELKLVPREDYIIGKTNKPHKFDNVIVFPNGRRATVDAVINDQSSIASRVVANFDVHSNDDSDNRVAQAIIYDDAETWKPNDLNVLHITQVPVMPFSSAGPALRHLLQA